MCDVLYTLSTYVMYAVFFAVDRIEECVLLAKKGKSGQRNGKTFFHTLVNSFARW